MNPSTRALLTRLAGIGVLAASAGAAAQTATPTTGIPYDTAPYQGARSSMSSTTSTVPATGAPAQPGTGMPGTAAPMPPQGAPMPPPGAPMPATGAPVPPPPMPGATPPRPAPKQGQGGMRETRPAPAQGGMRETRPAPMPGAAGAGAGVPRSLPQPQTNWQPTTDGLPAVQEVDGVRYVTGGFGLDESTAFRQAIPQYRLGMVFSQASGAYVANVPVRIEGRGNAPSLNVTATGPYLLIDLPQGRYRIQATYNGRELTRDVSVSGGRGHRVGFAW